MRQLNQGSFVLLYFRLSTFSDLYWVCLSVFSCTVLVVSISQVIGCEDCLRNDLYCVKWGVKLYSNSNQLHVWCLYFTAIVQLVVQPVLKCKHRVRILQVYTLVCSKSPLELWYLWNADVVCGHKIFLRHGMLSQNWKLWGKNSKN